jgi:hypothetical protein
MRCIVVGIGLAAFALGMAMVHPSRIIAAAPEQVKSVRADEIGTRAQIVGRLGKPMNTIMNLRGVWRGAPPAQAKPDLRLRFHVTEVDGKKLPEPVVFVDGLVDIRGESKPKPEAGAIWELRAFEAGQFRNSVEMHWKELGDAPRPPPDWGQDGPFVSEITGVVKSVRHEVEPANADGSKVEARFTAKVEWIELEGNRDSDVVPVGFDAHFLVGIEILSVEKAAKHFDKKGKVVLLIHSPAILFHGVEREKVPGRVYLFKVFGDMSNGRPHFGYAETEEIKSPEKKP